MLPQRRLSDTRNWKIYLRLKPDVHLSVDGNHIGVSLPILTAKLYKTIKAHKHYLSAISLVFRRMLNNHLTTTHLVEHVIRDFDFQTVKAAIAYVYGTSLRKMKVVDILMVHRFVGCYKVVTAKRNIEKFLANHMDTSNFFTIAAYAWIEENAFLKRCCFNFFKAHTDELYDTLSFCALGRYDSSLQYNDNTSTARINLSTLAFIEPLELRTMAKDFKSIPGLTWTLTLKTFDHVCDFEAPCFTVVFTLSEKYDPIDMVVRSPAIDGYLEFAKLQSIESNVLTFFFHQQIFMQNALIMDNFVEVTCIINVNSKSQSVFDTGLPAFPIYKTSTKKDTDFCIIADGKPLMAHKQYLSIVSRKFHDILKPEITHSGHFYYNIDDFDYDIVKDALRYIYGNPFGKMGTARVIMVLHFMVTYEVVGAVHNLEQFLNSIMTIDNFFTIVTYAWAAKNHTLKGICARFYNDNIKELTLTSNFFLLGSAIELDLIQLALSIRGA
uniref:BTB domain-containing protein n=1 Tax=Panagrellus redivivus TaxID=6233 RepID=A0A7E4VYU0_PANRE